MKEIYIHEDHMTINYEKFGVNIEHVNNINAKLRELLKEEFRKHGINVKLAKFDDLDRLNRENKPWINMCFFENLEWIENFSFDDKIFEKMQKDNSILIFNDIFECMGYRAFSYINSEMQKIKVNNMRDKIFYISMSISASQDYCGYRMKSGQSPIRNSYFYTFHKDSQFSDGRIENYRDYDPRTNKNRPKKYSYLVNQVYGREQRLWLMSCLANYECMDDGFVSMSRIKDWQLVDILTDMTPYQLEGFSKFKHKLPLIADRDAEWYAFEEGQELYKNSYFDVNILTQYRFVSAAAMCEKTMKSLFYKKTFITGGAPYFMKHLRDYGFETFGKWIDESYDNINNDQSRIRTIAREVKRLSVISNKEWDMMLDEMYPVLEHNYHHAHKINEKEMKLFVTAILEYYD